MKLGHLHIGFENLASAVSWMQQILNMKPVYENARMAVFSFGETSLIFDQSDTDTTTTIAFDSSDCVSDFERLVARHAEVIEAPTEQPWGVKAAYLRGPGKTVIEIEQILN